MNKGFHAASQITAIKPLVDRGMSITFHTKELPAEEQVEVIKYLSSAGWLLFKENEVQEEEIPKQDADIERKTASQRLRAVIFVKWKQVGEPGLFQDYYDAVMEDKIESVKQTLE